MDIINLKVQRLTKRTIDWMDFPMVRFRNRGRYVVAFNMSEGIPWVWCSTGPLDNVSCYVDSWHGPNLRMSGFSNLGGSQDPGNNSGEALLSVVERPRT